MRQRRAGEEQARLNNAIAGYHAQIKNGRQHFAFAASIGETASSPSCPTITDIDKQREYGMSGWWGTYAALDNRVYESNTYSHCNFRTSGGKLCKSYGTLISCVTGQQTSETYCIINGVVRRPGRDGFCSSLYPRKPSRSAQHRKPSAPINRDPIQN